MCTKLYQNITVASKNFINVKQFIKLWSIYRDIRIEKINFYLSYTIYCCICIQIDVDWMNVTVLCFDWLELLRLAN